ncbi:unnamed protein product [Microthlaspi erraticum]|uniref:Uncharacterized protein n=1 Tax=Microthlaspi erraticum TaxID=1685480 RepID=A0A6D2IMR5_9BRAS|nr:unnamed protein product [Microthlaspi erraticum]
MRELEGFKTTTLNQNNQYWPPVGAPTNLRLAEPWRSQLEDSVNAVSFGFVATAILISMFLVMAILRFFSGSDPSGSGLSGRIQ